MLNALDLAQVAIRSCDCNVAPGHSRCKKKITNGSCLGQNTGECESRRMKQSLSSLNTKSRSGILVVCTKLFNP